MTADLAQACADLAAWYPHAQALATQPDRQPTAGRTQPGSRPPWNAQAANAVLDIHASARAIEQDLRYHVTGRLLQRGGSDGNTLKALTSIPRLAEAVPGELTSQATRMLERLLSGVLVLPAVDLEERPRRIAAPCPYCRFRMLLIWPRERKITCLRRGLCTDSEGLHPVGELGTSRMDGTPAVYWRDGLVT